MFQLPHCKSINVWGCILLNISIRTGTIVNCYHYISCADTKACTAVKWTRSGNWPRLKSTQEWNISHNSLSLRRLWRVSSIKWIAASHCCLSDIDRSSKALCWITRCNTEHWFCTQWRIYSRFSKKFLLTFSSFFLTSIKIACMRNAGFIWETSFQSTAKNILLCLWLSSIA